jgi:hypothetical protein
MKVLIEILKKIKIKIKIKYRKNYLTTKLNLSIL